MGEATSANVVAHFLDQGLVTPPRGKVLPGVSQQVLFELADQLNISHAQSDITPEEITRANEVFLTSTSACMLPVVRIDGKKLGRGAPGPVYHQLLTAWSKLAGVDIVGQAERFAGREA